MAIPSINGQEINSSNAYQFYYGICHGKYPGIDENSDQAKWCQNFLSQDQITYCQKEDSDFEKDGADKLEDHENADKNANGELENEHGASNMAGAAVSATGSGLLLAGNLPVMIKSGLKVVVTSPWLALGWGVVMNSLSILALKGVQQLDPNKEARLANEAQSETDLATIKAHTQMMQEHQDSLEADAAEYEAQQAMLLDMRSENTNTLAGMQIEMNDALTAGDKDKAAELEASMSELEAMEFDTSGMDDIKMRSTEYGNAVPEADGLGGAGKNVADFLNEGNKLNLAYVTCGIGYGIGALGSATMAVGTFAGIKFTWDMVPAIAAAVLFTAAAVMFGIATGDSFKGAGEEAKCAEAGEKYADPLNSLSSEKDKLSEKIGSTEEGFEASDGAAAETMVEVDKAAEGAVAENTGTTPGGTPVSTGSSSGSSSGSTNA